MQKSVLVTSLSSPFAHTYLAFGVPITALSTRSLCLDPGGAAGLSRILTSSSQARFRVSQVSLHVAFLFFMLSGSRSQMGGSGLIR